MSEAPPQKVFKFHTKLIQSILDPVAQQVGQLVIAHEEAGEGNVAYDLLTPVKAVDGAVQNLVSVARQTLASSKDEETKRDMPPTFEAVATASKMLLDACYGISEDPSSKPHKKMLLEGSTGILQGVSSLLLVFDQGEVRKMVKECQAIIDYLKMAEIIQSAQEVTQFTKALTDDNLVVRVTKKIGERQQDLTSTSHADILGEEIEQIEKALPRLLSSVKAFVTLKQEKRKGAEEAQENRNYEVESMSKSFKEIIRVIQLTSPSEEEGVGALNGCSSQRGIVPGTLAAKVHETKTLLGKTGEDVSSKQEGILAAESVLKEAKRIAKTLPPERRKALEDISSEINAMAKELAELETTAGEDAKGEGGSERAATLVAAIGEKMSNLEKGFQVELTRKVAEDFKVDSLNALTRATLTPANATNRAENYAAQSESFRVHSKKMAETATSLARSGVITDRTLAEDINRTAKKVKSMAPQIENASKILFENPEDEGAKEHFEKLKEDYQALVEKLTSFVDSGIDSSDFIKVSKEQVAADLNKAMEITRAGLESRAAFAYVASAARAAKRVVVITKGEAENSLDVNFKSSLESSSDAITSVIAPMVKGAQNAFASQGDAAAIESFNSAADDLMSAIDGALNVVDRQYEPTPPPPRPPLPQPEASPAAPPRPPSPVEEPPPTKTEDPIGFAAHKLDKDTKQWEDNAMVESARKMADLTKQMGKFTRGKGGEVGSKKELINTSRMIAKEGASIVDMAKKVADACTDKRMKRLALHLSHFHTKL